jgi:alanyl-tRNA synthetase
MKTALLRKQFLNFFKERDHRIITSSPTIPHDDPTILFTNAGMNQFKSVFLGASKLDCTRASTSQKCVRVGGKHNDLDNVGFTTRHLTFFEMLGNFSFGDYFKEDAIKFAFDASKDVFKLDLDKLWVSVYQDDDEAFEIWKKYLPEKRIVRLGAKDNFWSMGDTGPCGPCTELLYDRGETFSKASSPLEDSEGERFFEFWNLVFMQFNKDTTGKMSALPKPCVDTGMGLERMASLLIGANTVFETDILKSIICATEELSKKKYEIDKPSFHVIADHLRMLSFTIADGAVPSNLDRGYVMRKVLRRALRYGKKLGFETPFLAKLFPTLLKEMGDDYPELKTSESKISEVLTQEEESFFKTLKRGGGILTTIIEKKDASKQISGEDAFKLKDTYGFPIEEILLIAKDNGLTVNLDSYELLEEEAKERSRKAQIKHTQVAEENLFEKFLEAHGEVEFVGYEELETSAKVIGILVDGEFRDKLGEGEEGGIILDKTPFYGEGGGQVGDAGKIAHNKAIFNVLKATKPFPGITMHYGMMHHGILLLGESVDASVNDALRNLTSRNHTATHLLHYALEKVLGPHIRQAGSLVEPNRFRFDFSHHKAMTNEEIKIVEELVNDKIRQNGKVETYFSSYDVIKEKKDIKQFFGEKYGSEVRVVDIAGFSKELCGGTHAKHLSEVGLFRIINESSIASGVRRIEGAIGKDAEIYMYMKEGLLDDLLQLLNSPLNKSKETLTSLIQEQKKLKEEIKILRKSQVNQIKEELIAKKQAHGNQSFIIAEVDVPKEELAPLANDLMNQIGEGAILLAIKDIDKCQLLLKISPNLVGKGLAANKLLLEIAKPVQGSGGGKADAAQAGGKDPSGLKEALALAKTLITSSL